MFSDYVSHDPTPLPTCYFSVIPGSSTHFSLETPISPPVSAYTPDIYSDPSNPLLAFRQLQLDHPMSTAEASRLLQLQTAAAHRPAAQPLQHSTSTSSNSSNSSSSSALLCCSRCRRETGYSGMVQFGTNLYYCNHCAKMTGYCAG